MSESIANTDNFFGARLRRHLFTWMALFIAGIAAILIVRSTGTRLVMWERMENAIDDVAAEYAEGNVVAAQETILGLLDTNAAPPASLIDRFGMDLLGMPNVIVRLQEASRPPEIDAALKGALIYGTAEDIDRMIDDIDQGATDDTALWAARQALVQGEFEDAFRRFDRYWKSRQRERGSLQEQIVNAVTHGQGVHSTPTATFEVVDRLFWWGLTDAAFEILRDAQDWESTMPELGLYVGARHEQQGGKAKAADAYHRLLDARPNHRIALIRLIALSAEEQ